MRTLIKLLMLVATLVFLGVNALSFMASSSVVKQTTAEHDPAVLEQFTQTKTKLDEIVATRALEERTNNETFKREWVSRESGLPDEEANRLQTEVGELAAKGAGQSLETAGAVAGAGIFAGGMLCISTGIYLVVLLVLGVLFFVFKPNTATIKVKHLN